MNKAKKFSFLSLILIAAICFVALATTFVKVTSAAESGASFAMDGGAEVRAVEGEVGIRWKATVNQTYYDSLNVEEGAEVKFGAVITAASLVGSGELTKDSVGVQEVLCGVTAPAFDENGKFSFYSSIVYNNTDDWTESDKKAAYATELVARAFIKVGETYNYVSEYPSARSMRAIALTAVQNGAEAELLSKYYGGNYTATDTVGYYGINDATSEFDLPADGKVAAYFGAQPVTAQVVNGKLQVSGIENLTAQENYSLNVFVGDNAFVQPFVAATNVIRKAEDLSLFELKDITKVQSVSIKSATLFDGYYVVANDIDASSYTHQALKDATLRAKLNGLVDSDGEPVYESNGRVQLDNNHYAKSEVREISDMAVYGGLTGTFDGAGHTISNLTVLDQGIFGLMANGTVKNVAFTGVNLKGSVYRNNICLFAQNVVAGAFEDVYVKANPIYGGDQQKEQSADARGKRALVAIQVGGYYNLIPGSKQEYKTTKFINCLFDYEIKNTKIQYNFSFGLYTQEAGYYTGADSAIGTKFNNVYVISNTALSVYNPSIVTKKQNSRVIIAENDVGENKTVADAAIAILDGCFYNSDAAQNTLDETMVKVAGRLKADETGVKRYLTADAMNADGNDYSSFNSATWTVNNGVLAWKAA